MRKAIIYAVAGFIVAFVAWSLIHLILMQWGATIAAQHRPLDSSFVYEVYEYYLDALLFPWYLLPSLHTAFKLALLATLVGYGVGISRISGKRWTDKAGLGDNWALINGLFLSGTGLMIWFIAVEYGTFGYHLSLLGTIILMAGVALGQRLMSNRLPQRISPWELAGLFSWMLDLFAITWLLDDTIEYLPYANQAPTGGISFLCMGTLLIALGPVTTLVASGFEASLVYLNRRKNLHMKKQPEPSLKDETPH